jgi:hypothetical protein
MHKEICQRDGSAGGCVLHVTQPHYDKRNSIQEPGMNEDKFNMSMRKFLKMVGVTSQQEIEKAVRGAVAKGELNGDEQLPVEMVLTIGKVSLRHKVDGTIELS